MSSQSERIHHWDAKEISLSFVLCSTIQTATLFVMFSTMGHAGPEGRFAVLGWVATGVNLPGLMLAGLLRLPENVSTLQIASTIYLLQLFPLWYLTFVVIRFLKTKAHRKVAK